MPSVIDTEPESSGGDFRPVIIGLIVGVFVLVIGLYFVLVERPRLKQEHYEKRAKAKRLYSTILFWIYDNEIIHRSCRIIW